MALAMLALAIRSRPSASSRRRQRRTVVRGVDLVASSERRSLLDGMSIEAETESGRAATRPQEQVDVGDGQRSAAAVAGRARGRRRRCRADDELHAVERQIEPPPAATVSMAIIGATMRTPAFSVSC